MVGGGVACQSAFVLPRRRQRWGESRLFSRIRRSTRLRATRMSRQTRSRAQTLRTFIIDVLVHHLPIASHQ